MTGAGGGGYFGDSGVGGVLGLVRVVRDSLNVCDDGEDEGGSTSGYDGGDNSHADGDDHLTVIMTEVGWHW